MEDKKIFLVIREKGFKMITAQEAKNRLAELMKTGLEKDIETSLLKINERIEKAILVKNSFIYFSCGKNEDLANALMKLLRDEYGYIVSISKMETEYEDVQGKDFSLSVSWR